MEVTSSADDLPPKRPPLYLFGSALVYKGTSLFFFFSSYRFAMNSYNRRVLYALALSAVLVVVAACGEGSVNGPIEVAEGTTHDGSVQTVNGPITVQKGARVDGSARSVNGSVKVAEEATAQRVRNVNGAIRLGRKARVENSVQTINGDVEAASGAVIGGDVESVNGDVRLTGATVEGGVSVVTASVTLEEGAVVRQDITVDQEDADSDTPGVTITLRGGSVVEGGIYVKGQSADVTLRLEGGSRVDGTIADRVTVERS